jgi:cell division protein ZapA
MAQVNLTICGKVYPIACDDGQEQRLIALGQYVDSKMKDISRSGAANNEGHLLVLTALVLADEIHDLREDVFELTEQNHYVQQISHSAEQDDMMLAQAIDHLATRIDVIAERIQKA